MKRFIVVKFFMHLTPESANCIGYFLDMDGHTQRTFCSDNLKSYFLSHGDGSGCQPIWIDDVGHCLR